MNSGRQKIAAFTLIEILITVGIIVMGMLPVLALLTIAVREQSSANHESVACIIAQGVFSDLRKSHGGMGGILYRRSSDFDLEDPGADPNTDFNVHILNPSSGDIYIVYGLVESTAGGGDWIHTPLEEIDTTSYRDGAANMRGTHLVRIHYENQVAGITHQNTNGDSAGADVFKPHLYEVVVSVEYPPYVKAVNRQSIEFRTYMTLSDRR